MKPIRAGKRQTTGKKALLFMLTAALTIALFGGCDNALPADTASSPKDENATIVSSQSSSAFLAPSSAASPQVVNNSLPSQVRDYLRGSLRGSSIIAISPEGEVVKTTEYPGQCFDNGRLSPNGRYMLCQTDVEGGGESYFCGYTVVDLQTGKQYDAKEKQSGYQTHVILSDSLIGYASGKVIGDQETTWKPIKLFDMQYRPLGVTPAFDYGKKITTADEVYDENWITGIGYNEKSEAFYLTYAKDLSQEGPQPEEHYYRFSVNRLEIAVFDKYGAFLENLQLPEEYSAPYSGNIRELLPNNPLVLPDGWLVINAMRKDRSSLLLLIDPKGRVVKELPHVRHGGSTALTDGLLAAYGDDSLEDSPSAALLDIQKGEITSTITLPKTIAVAGYPYEFTPQDVVWSDGKGYLAAYSRINDYKSFSGLFEWDGKAATLIHLLPSTYDWCNMLGIDNDGNCLVLIYGATEIMRDEYEDILSK